MGNQRDRRRADRVRAAICLALAHAGGPMTIGQLVATISATGIPLGPRPNKTIADAVRWEIGRGHVRRAGRGVFRIGGLPPSTERYMQVRVAAYVADPTQPCFRPNTRGDLA